MALPTPSVTLYVSNLETKTKKPELKAQLYSLFNPYGRVIDVVAQKHNGGRGQAFVVFEEQSAATAAMRGLTGEMFYDRDLRITYARNPSHATISLQDPESSREAAAVRAAKMTVSNAQGEYEQLERERVEEDMRLAGQAMGKRDLDQEGGEDGPAGKKAKTEHVEEDEDMEMDMEEDDDDDAPPAGNGKTLVCSNLPAECNDEIMGALFSQYPGFAKASPYPSSKPIPSSHAAQNDGAKAFLIAFDSADQAKAAMGETNGYVMQPGWEMGVSVQ